jgi:adenylate cyclase
MSIEIERKFLVTGDGWMDHVAERRHIRQGYLNGDSSLSLRIRVVDRSAATLTIKSAAPEMRRIEFEYQIPLEDAERLIALRQAGLVEKVRHVVPWHGRKWEVDVFAGDNAGLVIAEIELAHEGEALTLPPWVGREVTGEGRYYNSSLVRQPLQQQSGKALAPEHERPLLT